jgi:chromosome segregation ATPase
MLPSSFLEDAHMDDARIDRIETALVDLADGMRALQVLAARSDDRLGRLEERFERVEARLDRIDTRLERADARVDRLESKGELQAGRLEALEVAVRQGFADVGAAFVEQREYTRCVAEQTERRLRSSGAEH